MAVYVFILNPINQQEKNFAFPLATELFFHRVWMLGCEELKLDRIPIFSTGIDITKEDLPLIQIELEQLKTWARNRLSVNAHEHIETSINLLETHFLKNILGKDTVVFIG